jgi:multidrug efflux system outer membrane protein
VSQSTNSIADVEWWKVYQDPVLAGLIQEALTNNYDLKIAAARVEEARAIETQVRSQFVPNVDYSGDVSRGKNDLFGNFYPNSGMTTSSAVVGLNAFWEVDFWGRIRRQSEAAKARMLASNEGKKSVRLSLMSDVAANYFELQELDRELEIDAATTNSFGDSLTIFKRRSEGGKGNDLETARAMAALADANSVAPRIQDEIAKTENALCVLLGRVPGPIKRAKFGETQQLPPEVPAGLPAQLLERRPDIKQAEQLVRAANADVGESIAEFFPKIGLTALFGRISPELSAFSAGSSTAWGMAADATGPLFEGGKLVGQYRQTKAAKRESIFAYRQSVLIALHDVSDALSSNQRLVDIRNQQSIEVESLQRAVKLSSERFVAGKANYYEVLEAQQQLFPAQLNLARTERDQMLSVVSLYKSLGGGWQDK